MKLWWRIGDAEVSGENGICSHNVAGLAEGGPTMCQHYLLPIPPFARAAWQPSRLTSAARGERRNTKARADELTRVGMSKEGRVHVVEQRKVGPQPLSFVICC